MLYLSPLTLYSHNTSVTDGQTDRGQTERPYPSVYLAQTKKQYKAAQYKIDELSWCITLDLDQVGN